MGDGIHTMEKKTGSDNAALNFDREMRFTEVHQAHLSAHPYAREIACLRVQAEMIFRPIQEGDYFAGRIERLAVGLDPERGDLVEAAYFCRFPELEDQLKQPDLPQENVEQIQTLIEYWKQHSTYFKCRSAFPEHIQRDMPSDDYYAGLQISFPMYGLGGPCLDYEKLLRLGIPGLREQVLLRKTAAGQDPNVDLVFLTGVENALDIYSETAIRYIKEARQLAWGHPDPETRNRLQLIADSLEWIISNPPQTYFQAIQLLWLYSLFSLTRNYGRMDLYLGDFLASDIESGRLTEAEALEMTVGLWRLIVARGDNFNNRILIGGRGRPNEKNADRFALLALEAQAIVNEAIPQLSVRWYDGMNPQILDKSIEVLATGSTMPILYNDDTNIPGVQKAMAVSEEEAEQYAFYGCGEFLIDHRSIASPDAAINILKVLDVTLRNGIDSFTGEKRGLDLGSLESFADFKALQAAFARQVDYQMGMLADVQSVVYRETGKEAAFPFISLLYDDCIERGKPVLTGGVRYKGGTVESFGNNSAADALLAIKKRVYEEKLISPERLLACLDSNFAGCEREWKLLTDVPKFGNDNVEADAMSVWVNELVCDSAKQQSRYTPLDSFLVVLINNGDSVVLGKATGASADGRRLGQPLSNGNQPSAGNDFCGVTALLNSMARLDAGLHAGTTQNIKFARALLREHPEQVKALIRAYFNQGGTQIMVTSTDRGELEAALENPQAYRHIFVRVGGYSERFVDLPRDIQLEVIQRTLY